VKRDATIAERVSTWFERHGRDLPWRAVDARGQRDAYRALVSEFMLQQTQVSRVLDYFDAFLSRFPDCASLANAHEDDVRAVWSGLGYYARARRLHAAAREIVARFSGVVPACAADLRSLPGVGRYTAGAIGSIVFGRAEAIVDGNVSRVLARVDGVARSPAEDWTRATELVQAAAKPGLFNEGLMELGATVCTPRSPKCPLCPLSRLCRARTEGTVEQLPPVREKPSRQVLHCAAVVAVDGRGRVLLEQRPAQGLFASLWQAPTMESTAECACDEAVRVYARCRSVREVGRFSFATTHRAIEMRVLRGFGARAGASRVWRAHDELKSLGMGNLQRRVLVVGTKAADDVQC
jgi:A/G-specific adenine glycosylase